MVEAALALMDLAFSLAVAFAVLFAFTNVAERVLYSAVKES